MKYFCKMESNPTLVRLEGAVVIISGRHYVGENATRKSVLNSQNQQSSFHGVPLIACLVPSNDLCPDCMVYQAPENLQINFIPSQLIWLLDISAPDEQAAWSFRFYPPHCYQLSKAGTSSLLRNHLPPHIASVGLELPLVPPYPCNYIDL